MFLVINDVVCHDRGMKGKQTLAKEVKKARFDLGFQTRVSFANHIGMSTRIVGEIENAWRDSYSEETLWAIDKGLHWRQGTAEALLNGTDLPVPDARMDTESPSDPEGRWRTVENDGTHFLEVSASYDPALVQDEDLEWVALSARRLMRVRLEDIEARRRRPIAFPAPMPEEQEKAAFDPYIREDYKYGDEDEQTQVEP